MLLVRINLVLVCVLALAGLTLGLVDSATLRANAERILHGFLVSMILVLVAICALLRRSHA